MRLLVLALLLPLAVAADPDSDQAPRLLGTRPVKGDPAVQLKKDAAAGDPQALYEVARDYETGKAGFPHDLDKALALYAEAGARGNSTGYFRLGMIYDDGIGVNPDSPKALGFFKAAAGMGDAEAQYNVGTLLVSAHGGVKRDWVEGLAWLIVARKNGAAGDGETAVRTHLARHPELIASAEKRADRILSEKLKFPPPDVSVPPPASERAEVAPPPLDVPPTHVGPPGT